IEAAKPLAASTSSREPVLDEEPTRSEIEEDERRVIKSGVWTPLTPGAHRLWPRLEGGVVAQQAAPRLAVAGPSEAPVGSVLPPLASSSPKRPEWLNKIKALRRDRHEAVPEAAAPAPKPVAPVEPPAPQEPTPTDSDAMASAAEADDDSAPGPDAPKGPSRS